MFTSFKELEAYAGLGMHEAHRLANATTVALSAVVNARRKGVVGHAGWQEGRDHRHAARWAKAERLPRSWTSTASWTPPS